MSRQEYQEQGDGPTVHELINQAMANFQFDEIREGLRPLMRMEEKQHY